MFLWVCKGSTSAARSVRTTLTWLLGIKSTSSSCSYRSSTVGDLRSMLRTFRISEGSRGLGDVARLVAHCRCSLVRRGMVGAMCPHRKFGGKEGATRGVSNTTLKLPRQRGQSISDAGQVKPTQTVRKALNDDTCHQHRPPSHSPFVDQHLYLGPRHLAQNQMDHSEYQLFPVI